VVDGAAVRVAIVSVAIPNVSGTISTASKPAARTIVASRSPEGNSSTDWFR
jgi:hypothetical protein